MDPQQLAMRWSLSVGFCMLAAKLSAYWLTGSAAILSDAIESAIATASRSLRNLDWFEVVDVRGSIRDNKVANYQVTLKLGLRYVPKA
jgi:flavin-binding protein dodecin